MSTIYLNQVELLSTAHTPQQYTIRSRDLHNFMVMCYHNGHIQNLKTVAILLRPRNIVVFDREYHGGLVFLFLCNAAIVT